MQREEKDQKPVKLGKAVQHYFGDAYTPDEIAKILGYKGYHGLYQLYAKYPVKFKALMIGYAQILKENREEADKILENY